MKSTILQQELTLASEIADAIELQERLVELSHETIKGVAGQNFPNLREKAEQTIVSANAKIALKKEQLKAVLQRIITKL